MSKKAAILRVLEELTAVAMAMVLIVVVAVCRLLRVVDRQ